MNKELRIREKDDQKVYVTSDTHFGHHINKAQHFIVEKRGFTNVNDMDRTIIDSINERVRPTDILFHLGDFCLNTDENGFNSYLSRINCQNIYHIWGNHNNPPWTVYKNEVHDWMNHNHEGYASRKGSDIESFDPMKLEVEIYPFRYRNIVFLGNYLEAQINGMKYVMAHYPIYVFNEMKHGVRHLCGHSHGSLPFSTPECSDSKVLDCGWDVHRKPLSVNEILDIMDTKNILRVDHHAK
jgi:calcineurin-like phosphoesterase family protein